MISSSLLAVLQSDSQDVDVAHGYFLQGIALSDQGQYQAAIIRLEHARLLLTAQGHAEKALRAILELVRLHHWLENLNMARVYAQMASDWLVKGREDTLLAAEALLRVATLALETENYREGEQVALRALQRYEAKGDLQGICDAWLLLFHLHNQTGRHPSAGAYLQLVTSLVQAANLGVAYDIAALCSNAHWHWYRGELEVALQAARQAVELADAAGQSKQRVYNRVVAGNLELAMGQGHTARRWYQDAEQLAREIGFPQSLSWVHVQQAWLAILQERYEAARWLLQRVRRTQDSGKAMSFGVFQGVLYSLTERAVEATDLLDRSLAYYLQSCNLLAANTVRLHLAANWLRSGELALATEALGMALQWMAEQQIDYLPLWWHPPTMTMLCTHALQLGIQPALAEQVLVRYLGASASVAMQDLLRSDDPVVVRRAADVLALLDSGPLAMLGDSLDAPVRAVLTDLLTTRRLLAAGLASLAARLMTAERRETPNPTLVAVFGLYVHDVPRKEIAAQLHLSDAAVRNYINHIFKVFELPYDSAQRSERRLQLRAQALAAGYIGDMPARP